MSNLPNEITVIVWEPNYAGARPTIVEAGEGADEGHPLANTSSYDGVSIETDGEYLSRVLKKPASIAALEEKGATFGATRLNDVGCWFDGKPHRFAEYSLRWTWNLQERLYLEAVFHEEIKD